MLAGGRQATLNTSSFGRTYFSGLRWQRRHHSICSDSCCHMSGIWSTWPWQVVQPTPLFTWALWLKYTKSGRSCTFTHSSAVPSRQLARTGSSVGLSLKICEWQFMQVLVGGMPATADLSTLVWQ